MAPMKATGGVALAGPPAGTGRATGDGEVETAPATELSGRTSFRFGWRRGRPNPASGSSPRAAGLRVTARSKPLLDTLGTDFVSVWMEARASESGERVLPPGRRLEGDGEVETAPATELSGRTSFRFGWRRGRPNPASGSSPRAAGLRVTARSKCDLVLTFSSGLGFSFSIRGSRERR